MPEPCHVTQSVFSDGSSSTRDGDNRPYHLQKAVNSSLVIAAERSGPAGVNIDALYSLDH